MKRRVTNEDLGEEFWQGMRENDLDVCTSCIECGLDPDFLLTIGSGRPVSLLELTVKHKQTKIARMLIQAGAYVNRSEYSWPLLMAAQQGDIESIKVLIEGGCDVNETGLQRENVLHECYDLETMKLLLDSGAWVNNCRFARGDASGESVIVSIYQNCYDISEVGTEKKASIATLLYSFGHKIQGNYWINFDSNENRKKYTDLLQMRHGLNRLYKTCRKTYYALQGLDPYAIANIINEMFILTGGASEAQVLDLAMYAHSRPIHLTQHAMRRQICRRFYSHINCN